MNFKFFLILFLIASYNLLSDERAPSGKCYVAMGYVADKSEVRSFAKDLFINPEHFEIFERRDKKIYFTLGKINEKLFKSLQNQGKTYNFNCASGKGYIKRYGLDSQFNLTNGNKKFLDTELHYFWVTSTIEEENKRIEDEKLEREVQRRLNEQSNYSDTKYD